MNTATLTALFDKRQLALTPAELLTYEVDAGYDRGRPDGVFFPESTEDVSLIMRWAAPQHVPLIARGAGTGLSGGAVPEHGGIVVSLARMNQVVELNPTGRQRRGPGRRRQPGLRRAGQRARPLLPARPVQRALVAHRRQSGRKRGRAALLQVRRHDQLHHRAGCRPGRWPRRPRRRAGVGLSRI